MYHGGPLCVRSLTFVSNQKIHGPFGVELGTFFSVPKAGERIVGFYGRSGWFLDAIGAYLKPFEQRNVSKPMVHSQNYVTNGVDQSGYSVIHGSLGKDYDIVLAIKQRENYSHGLAPPKITEVDTNSSPVSFSRQSSRSDFSDVEGKDKVRNILGRAVFLQPYTKCNVTTFTLRNFLMFFQVLALPPVAETKPSGVVTHGPWGGNGGTLFDDGVYKGVREIIISRNVGIVYVKVLYEQNGVALWGSRNGGTGGFKREKVIV